MSVESMKAKRDQAFACLVLAASVTIAVFVSAFGGADMPAIEEAKHAVAVHEELLKQSTKYLAENQAALDTVRSALNSFVQSQRP
jgi:hypothetical protein